MSGHGCSVAQVSSHGESPTSLHTCLAKSHTSQREVSTSWSHRQENSSLGLMRIILLMRNEMKMALKFAVASTVVGASVAFIVTSVIVGTTTTMCVNMILKRRQKE